MRKELSLLSLLCLASPAAVAANGDWTGWHVGGHAGHASGDSRANVALGGEWSIETQALRDDVSAGWSTDLGPDGSAFGLLFGYDHQFANGFVLGAELDYASPYQLLVAVVLSAQATDVSVNLATRKLFKVADTPEKMLALGEERVRDHIKTIGLFNSIMFPVIFTLTLERSSASKEATSGFLCFAIVGGAFVPLLVGAVSGATSYATAFVVPAACYLVLLVFGLAAAGARPQYMLWASTGTKNPAYSDLLYVEPLIGAETVNTLPDATLDALRDHGRVASTLEEDVEQAAQHFVALAAAGIDMVAVGERLQQEGLAQFEQAFAGLLELTA